MFSIMKLMKILIILTQINTSYFHVRKGKHGDEIIIKHFDIIKNAFNYSKKSEYVRIKKYKSYRYDIIFE